MLHRKILQSLSFTCGSQNDSRALRRAEFADNDRVIATRESDRSHWCRQLHRNGDDAGNGSRVCTGLPRWWRNHAVFPQRWRRILHLYRPHISNAALLRVQRQKKNPSATYFDSRSNDREKPSTGFDIQELSVIHVYEKWIDVCRFGDGCNGKNFCGDG